MTQPINTQPPVDLSHKGVDRILARLADAGIEVHYNETDGDHHIDLHLTPIEDDDPVVVLCWYSDRQGWRIIESTVAGEELRRWPIGHVDMDAMVARAAELVPGILDAMVAGAEPAADAITLDTAASAALAARVQAEADQLELDDDAEPVEQVPDTIADLIRDGWRHDATDPWDRATLYSLTGPDGEAAEALIAEQQGQCRVEIGGLTETQVTAALTAIHPAQLAKAEQPATEQVEPDLRQRLAAELHRIADDIVRLELPLAETMAGSLDLGVLDSRADLDRWAAYLGSTVRVDGNNIPWTTHRISLVGYAGLDVRAQTLADGLSEVERLRAENEALRAQLGGAR